MNKAHRVGKDENHKQGLEGMFAAAGPLEAMERDIVGMYLDKLRAAQMEFNLKQRGLQQYCAKLIEGKGLKVEEWTVNCDTMTIEPLPEDKRRQAAPAAEQATPAPVAEEAPPAEEAAQ